MKQRILALVLSLATCVSMTVFPTSAADYRVKQIEGGYNNSFVVTQDGTLYACGLNEQGVLGDIPTELRDGSYIAPTLQKMAEGVKEVAACEEHVTRYYKNPYEQGNHVLILMENGELYAQGDNLYAQLGQGDRDTHEGMQFVMDDVIAMDAGGYFSACVTENGDLYWWGYLVQQLGGNQVANKFTPEKVGTGFVDVTAGVCTLTALKADGTVWTMGSSAYGARGDGTMTDLTREPEQVFSGAVEIASGANHTLVRTASGDVYGWGDNGAQQILAHEEEGKEVYDAEGYVIEAPTLLNHEYTTPAYIMGGAKTIDASYANSYILKENGDLYTMGMIYHGQFGLELKDTVEPRPAMHTASNVKQVSAGYRATYILKEDGTTYAAGNNYDYCFGNGTSRISEKKWIPCFFTAVPIHEKGSIAFTDVKQGDWFHDSVLWAVEQNITSGTGDGTTFSPNATCSRAQIITFLWAAAGKQPSMNQNFFMDVTHYEWYSKAVCWAQEGVNKILDASEHNYFYPDAPCTRAMAVEFMWRAAGRPSYDTSALPFRDVSAKDSYAQAVAWALDMGVTAGTGDGTTFSPNDTCTRAQIATFLWRAFG